MQLELDGSEEIKERPRIAEGRQLMRSGKQLNSIVTLKGVIIVGKLALEIFKEPLLYSLHASSHKRSFPIYVLNNIHG